MELIEQNFAFPLQNNAGCSSEHKPRDTLFCSLHDGQCRAQVNRYRVFRRRVVHPVENCNQNAIAVI